MMAQEANKMDAGISQVTKACEFLYGAEIFFRK